LYCRKVTRGNDRLLHAGTKQATAKCRMLISTVASAKAFGKTIYVVSKRGLQAADKYAGISNNKVPGSGVADASLTSSTI